MPKLYAITLDISGLDLNIPLQFAQCCSNGCLIYIVSLRKGEPL